MAFEACVCGVRFAVGLLRCPRCGVVSPRYASRVPLEVRARVSVPSMPVLRGEHGPEVTDLPPGGLVAPSFKQLRAVAKSLGLSAGGTAEELAARIAEHDAAKAGE